MWERTLQDLIRGLRANKDNEHKFIGEAMVEIRNEVRSKEMEIKAGAVLKMAFLQMLGYDPAWIGFNILEVMSSQKYHLKCVGYLAATQTFKDDTEILMLANNSLKKDLSSTPGDVALALSGLSHFVTPDLGRDFTSDLNAMLNHSRAYIRKRTILTLFRVIQKHPDALRHCLPRLREKLNDPDTTVVSATVNLFCELSRRVPQELLSLAPQLFQILTTSSNNWVLIKVIKLFGNLSPSEPRLVKKLQGPITDLIQSTNAISLLYECVHTCIIGGMLDGSRGESLARLCVTKLAGFLGDSDQNLKYIALLAMVKIIPSHPHLVAEHQAVIVLSIDDDDLSIRMKALELVSSMVASHNLQQLVQQLLGQLARAQTTSTNDAASSLANATTPNKAPTPSLSTSPQYRLDVSNRILDMCSRDMYENVSDFEWYLSVLLDLTYVAGVDIGSRIRDQFVDIALRVKAARDYAVKLMLQLLEDASFISNAADGAHCSEVLWAAAWIVGEYCREEYDLRQVTVRLLFASSAGLQPETTAVVVNALIKVFGYWTEDLAIAWDPRSLPPLKSTVENIMSELRLLASDNAIEVQERASNALQLFTLVAADIDSFKPAPLLSEDQAISLHFPKSLLLFKPLFLGKELKPVASDAQGLVPIPEGLDLDAWIVPPDKPQKHVEGEKKAKRKTKKSKGKERADDGGLLDEPHDPQREETAEERLDRERRKIERIQRMDDPYYLKDERQASLHKDDIDAIPIVKLEDLPSLSSQLQERPLSRSATALATSIHNSPKIFEIDRGGEAPPGAAIIRALGIGASPSPSLRSLPQSRGTPDQEFQPQLSSPPPIVVSRPKAKASRKSKKATVDIE